MVLDLESRMAVVESRVDEMGRTVDKVVPLIAGVARMEEKLTTLTNAFEDMKKTNAEDRRTAADERKSVRSALYIMSGSIGAAVIGAAGLIISQGS